MRSKDELKNKSLYWKNFPEQYTIDENGIVRINDDADEEVKKSYKQYSIEQMMAGYFIEEEEEEEEVERTFSVSDDAIRLLKEATEDKKIDIKEMHLKKDYSMYSWMSQKQYYKVVNGEYIFNEDTPEEVLESYKRYNKQLKRIDNIAEVKGSPIMRFLFDGLKSIKRKK